MDNDNEPYALGQLLGRSYQSSDTAQPQMQPRQNNKHGKREAEIIIITPRTCNGFKENK